MSSKETDHASEFKSRCLDIELETLINTHCEAEKELCSHVTDLDGICSKDGVCKVLDKTSPVFWGFSWLEDETVSFWGIPRHYSYIPGRPLKGKQRLISHREVMFSVLKTGERYGYFKETYQMLFALSMQSRRAVNKVSLKELSHVTGFTENFLLEIENKKKIPTLIQAVIISQSLDMRFQL